MTESKSKGFDFNKAFQTDPTKELDGAWTSISMGGDSMKIQLARKDNNRAQAYLRALLRTNEHDLDANDDKANELFLEIRRKVIARCIILDWEDVLIDGKDTPYSEELCEKLLSFTDFFTAVEKISGDFSVFRAKKDDKILKN